MNKEELIQLHTLLVQVKEYFEENNFDCDFTKYNELGITPLRLHRRKEEHKQAVFILLTELILAAKKHLGE
jgi:hypothetical protein